ncbi:hypothetical protein AN189_00155 [Loktanella sp. 3ANDIMAR09]|uniref:NUDIX domain-containing protein n=1 Tax=Loktanella sp. 3ANDIMAR09 TaxID=1225657 RepID=UPI0006FA9D31|nr:NUDIX hydrolase [Loktanella sp. 3ANDIMAR09]KQI69870.1 hypothetical protein AN189_00155 [Loktanella sp. 3ANDIMAR09]
MTTTGFDGAKVALFIGDRLLVIRRDDRPDIAYPDHWDFPGGGREGDETPFQTIVRETLEEVGLCLTPADIRWQTCDQSDRGVVWFFVAQLPGDARVTFGDEGQFWRLATVTEVLHWPDVAGQLQKRLANWLAGQAACDVPPAAPPV